MKLFIIGNGFDKGHGLNTSYWDFRTYLKNMYPEFCMRLKAIIIYIQQITRRLKKTFCGMN